MTVAPINRKRPRSSARAQTYGVLREQIVSLALAPGERVSDLAWAERLGVSRTPVREALLQLAEEDLIDVIPQGGTFVARISLGAVREAQFVREALERAVVRTAAERITAEELAALRRNVDEQREAEAAADFAHFYQLDERLHRLLMDASGHPGVWRVADRTRAHLNRVRRLSLPLPETLSELVGQHAEFCSRLNERDAAGAEEVMTEHLRLVHRNLPSLVAAHPDFFVDTDDGTW